MSSSADSMSESDRALIQKMKADDTNAFEQLFYSYYHELCSLAYKITRCPEQARDVVQDVFYKLWKKRNQQQINRSLKAYLYQAVWNQALNKKDKTKNQQELRETFSEEQNFRTAIPKEKSDDRVSRLITEIWRIVDEMAERRKFVFTLHRKHGLSYKEIATVMNISRKTVENHMGLALQEIRETISPDLLKL